MFETLARLACPTADLPTPWGKKLVVLYADLKSANHRRFLDNLLAELPQKGYSNSLGRVEVEAFAGLAECVQYRAMASQSFAPWDTGSLLPCSLAVGSAEPVSLL